MLVSVAALLVATGCSAQATWNPVGGGVDEGGGGAGGWGGAGGAAGGEQTHVGSEGTYLFDLWKTPNEGQGGAPNTGCGAQVFSGVVRDFRAFDGETGHPDFQVYTGAGEKGIVKAELGEDHKPVYAPEGASEMTSGKEAFDQWFRDVKGVNLAIPLTLEPEVDEDGLATYKDLTFFPIDGQGFGDELFWHNFHFTFELHMSFVYEGGEVFSFAGDDDLWVFVNNRLAIDLGGVHEGQSDTLDMDKRAVDLGLEIGKEYPLDLFQAERHTTESKFMVQSTLAFTNCEPIVY